MTNDELAARQLVLEAFAMAALGLAMRIAAQKLTTRQLIVVTDGLKVAAKARLKQEGVSSAAHSKGLIYLDDLLSGFSEVLMPRKPDRLKRKNRDK